MQILHKWEIFVTTCNRELLILPVLWPLVPSLLKLCQPLMIKNVIEIYKLKIHEWKLQCIH